MGKQRFPSIEYRNNIQEETQERIEEKGVESVYVATYSYHADVVTDWVNFQRYDSSRDTLLTLLMNSDERYADSHPSSRNRPNYQIFRGGLDEELLYEYQRIDHARNRWFKLVDEYLPTDAEEDHQLDDFES